MFRSDENRRLLDTPALVVRCVSCVRKQHAVFVDIPRAVQRHGGSRQKFSHRCYHGDSKRRTNVNLLAPELFFLILAHSVYKT